MNKKSLRFQQSVSALLFLAAIGLLGWLSTQFKTEFDWTANNRNSLTEASARQLGNMQGPVKVLAFAPAGPENRADTAQFFVRYTAVKKDLTVEFIDPIKSPTKVREFNIQQVGDLVLEYDGRRETVRAGEMNEASVTQALQRLSFAEQRFVVFLQGHGERGVADTGAAGYSAFEQLLKENGFASQPLNLGTSPRVPDNAALVVVAGPSSALQAGETRLLLDYLAAGGNLLWLSDPDSPPPPVELAQALGVSFEKGTAIFPEYAAMTQDPSLFLTASYPATPVTQNLTENTLFPIARALSTDPAAKPDPAWQPQPFLQSTQQAWIETGPLEGEIGFEPEQGDKPGPLTLGLLLTRNLKAAADAPQPKTPDDPMPVGKPQRAAIVGDSDFLSNAILAQAGNGKLGLNLVRWLASRDDQLDITVPEARDQALSLSPWAVLALQVGFLILLPLLLLAIGIGRWLSRRRR
ncbi:MAG: DUF4350 domain-containing protein [Pseudomonadota bacterium]